MPVIMGPCLFIKMTVCRDLPPSSLSNNFLCSQLKTTVLTLTQYLNNAAVNVILTCAPTEYIVHTH